MCVFTPHVMGACFIGFISCFFSYLIIYGDMIPCSWLFCTPEGDTASLIRQGSSVICRGHKHTDRQCHFNNLCYLPQYKNFVFLHSNNSQIINIPNPHSGSPVLDLSSVEDHNQHYFDYVDLPSQEIERFEPEIDSKVTLVMSRFLPGNLMHALHDDILPLYYTSGNIAHEQKIPRTDIQFLFMDDNPEHEFEHLYTALSDMEPSTKSAMILRNRSICFQNLYVGVARDTLWYQYGFKTFQGPLSNAFKLSPKLLSEFRQLMNTRLNIEEKSLNDYLVLVTRKENRLILNELELILKLSSLIKIVTVSLEDFSVDELVQSVSNSRGLVGMHGSLLSLAVFLPRHSVLIELFPYAIPPENYTPYRTMSKLPGLHIVYRSWVNDKVENTLTHPGWEPEYGGIEHLPLELQDLIISNQQVPPHLCCKDPNWLYRIYQDTVVNVDEVYKLTKEALVESRRVKKRVLSPASVGDVSCTDDKIQWEQPWNLQYLLQPEDKLKYEVWIQKTTSLEYKTMFTRNTFLKVETSETSEYLEYSIWIRCHLNDVIGPFSGHKSCSFRSFKQY